VPRNAADWSFELPGGGSVYSLTTAVMASMMNMTDISAAKISSVNRLHTTKHTHVSLIAQYEN
jgi:formiminotetrahydrofolate cyclodeaminase